MASEYGTLIIQYTQGKPTTLKGVPKEQYNALQEALASGGRHTWQVEGRNGALATVVLKNVKSALFRPDK